MDVTGSQTSHKPDRINPPARAVCLPCTLLTLGVLSPDAISFSLSFSFSFCLVSISSSLVSHDQIFTGTAKPSTVPSLHRRPLSLSLSFFGILSHDFGRGFPKELCVQIWPQGLVFIERGSRNCPRGEGVGVVAEKVPSSPLQPFAINCLLTGPQLLQLLMFLSISSLAPRPEPID